MTITVIQAHSGEILSVTGDVSIVTNGADPEKCSVITHFSKHQIWQQFNDTDMHIDNIRGGLQALGARQLHDVPNFDDEYSLLCMFIDSTHALDMKLKKLQDGIIPMQAAVPDRAIRK